MNNKFIDLDALSRYDEKIKEVINTKQDEMTAISDEEIGDLFEQDILESRYVPQEAIQEALETEY